jgi:hypothetical protein
MGIIFVQINSHTVKAKLHSTGGNFIFALIQKCLPVSELRRPKLFSNFDLSGTGLWARQDKNWKSSNVKEMKNCPSFLLSENLLCSVTPKMNL